MSEQTAKEHGDGGNDESTSNKFRLNPDAVEFVPKFTVPATKPAPQYNNQHDSNNKQAQSIQPKNNNFMNNQNDIDPIELEARCEAVVEILQDERIRQHINVGPESGGDQVDQLSQQAGELALGQHPSTSAAPDSGEPDEDEILEMMAMQDECRMEMMKFYIQSQNPELFSEIYHDLSYPEENYARPGGGAAPNNENSSPQPPRPSEKH